MYEKEEKEAEFSAASREGGEEGQKQQPEKKTFTVKRYRGKKIWPGATKRLAGHTR